MAVSKVEQKKFTKEIINIQKTQSMTIMESVLRYAEMKGVDVVNITKYISPSLKTKIAAEARDLNLLKTKRRK